MSALRIKVGSTWWTGAPVENARAFSPAAAVGFNLSNVMQARGGPDWPARRVWDGGQRGVTIHFMATREFPTIADMATWLAVALSLEPAHAWQGDAILHWEHEDGIGYTTSRLPWAALSIGSIEHDGPRTLRMQLSIMGPELEDFNLFSRALIITEDGRPIITEDGRPLVAESHSLVTAN